MNAKPQTHRPKRLGPVVTERELFQSVAWRSLNPTSHVVLADFWMKRQVVKNKKRGIWEMINNGQLVYTYTEAEKNGITRPAFARALDDLIFHGFIDIAKTGAGQCRAVTLYTLSDRWRKFGTADFEKRARPLKKQWNDRAGFQPRADGKDGTL